MASAARNSASIPLLLPPSSASETSVSRSAVIGLRGNLKFLLSLSGVEIRTRCEVRYCLKGVGIGVEFVGISPDAVEEIEREIELCAQQSKANRRSVRKT